MSLKLMNTVTVKDDERNDHQDWMPIELGGWEILPGESAAEVECPDEHEDDDQTRQAGRHSVEQRHPFHLRLVG